MKRADLPDGKRLAVHVYYLSLTRFSPNLKSRIVFRVCLNQRLRRQVRDEAN